MVFFFDLTITPANLGSPAASVADYVFKIFVANMNADFVAALRADGMDIRVSADGGSTWLDKDLVGFSQATPAGYIAFRSTMDHTNNMVFRFQGDGSTSYANANTTYRAAYKLEIPANEASGNLTDHTQYGNHMTPTNTPTYGQSGLYGPAIGFDSTDDNFYASDSASLSALYAKTILIWMKRAGTGSTGTLISKDANNQREWASYVGVDGSVVNFYNFDDNNKYIQDLKNPISLGTDLMFIAIKNAGGRTTYTKNNGTNLITSTSDSGGFVTVRDRSAVLAMGNAYPWNSACIGVYNQIEIFNESISASETTAIYNMITNSATLGSKSATSGLATGNPWYYYAQQAAAAV